MFGINHVCEHLGGLDLQNRLTLQMLIGPPALRKSESGLNRPQPKEHAHAVKLNVKWGAPSLKKGKKASVSAPSGDTSPVPTDERAEAPSGSPDGIQKVRL